MKLQTKLIISFFAMILLMGVTQSIFLQSKIQVHFQNLLRSIQHWVYGANETKSRALLS